MAQLAPFFATDDTFVPLEKGGEEADYLETSPCRAILFKEGGKKYEIMARPRHFVNFGGRFPPTFW